MYIVQKGLLSFLMLPILVMGQESEFIPVSNSSQVIESLNNRAKEVTTFRCDFKQEKYMSYLDAVVESKGKFLLKGQQQIRWEYTNPYQYLIIINNGKLTVKTPKQNEGVVPKENKLFDQLNNVVQSVFKGKLGQDNNFTTILLENKNSYRLRLIPKQTDLKKVFSEVNLLFNKTTLDISKVQIIEVSGDYTSLSFENLVLNKIISSSEFIIE